METYIVITGFSVVTLSLVIFFLKRIEMLKTKLKESDNQLIDKETRFNLLAEELSETQNHISEFLLQFCDEIPEVASHSRKKHLANLFALKNHMQKELNDMDNAIAEYRKELSEKSKNEWKLREDLHASETQLKKYARDRDAFGKYLPKK